MKTVEFNQFAKNPENGISRAHGFQFGIRTEWGSFKTIDWNWSVNQTCFNRFKLVLQMDETNG